MSDLATTPADAAAYESRRIVAARGLRGLADGCLAVLLPAYLLALGHEAWVVGLVGTLTLLGSAAATLAIGAFGHRWASARLLPAAAALMAITGFVFGSASSLWLLLVVAFVGTLNPSAGDASVFLPLEHARLAALADGPARTRLFARYTITGSLAGACGALLAGMPTWLAACCGTDALAVLRAMFVAYGGVGLIVWTLYRRGDRRREPVGAASHHDVASATSAPLGPSRTVVIRLAALFAVDSFAGGLVVNSLLALWLATRFGLDVAQAGSFFFVTGLLSTASQWLAPRVAERIGLVNTMVFTHIPANLCLLAAALAPSLPWALALLFARAALSQMDVPTRSAFVMAVVTPAERTAAASFTAVPRSLAAAAGPALAGAGFAAGALAAPLVAAALLKIGYDLALWFAFRRHEAAR